MNTSEVGLHTICYAPGMVDTVDPAFLPFDVSADPQTERRETAHMLSFWRKGLHHNHRVSGLLSPKFTEKTGLSGKTFKDIIVNNPDFDVWFMNPYPSWFYLSYNVWEQGEIWHPGLCERAAEVFNAANIAIDPRNFPRSTKRTLLFSNLWAGTPYFWDQFMPFIDKISTHAEKILGVSEQAFYFARKVSYWPFLFERLFTTFLVMRPDIRVGNINLEMSQLLKMNYRNKMRTLLLREWAPMIEGWDRSGSYNEDRRAVFRALQKMEVLLLLGNNSEHQNALLGL